MNLEEFAAKLAKGDFDDEIDALEKYAIEENVQDSSLALRQANLTAVKKIRDLKTHFCSGPYFVLSWGGV